MAWGAPQTEAVFVGAALVATSVGITASALSARGLLHEAASKIILAAAVIDDVPGLIVLAAVSSLATGHVNFLEIALTAGLPAAFTVVLAKWGSSAANRILPHFCSRARTEDAQFHFSLILLFALSALAVYAGVAAIVGAFLAGLALSDTADDRVRDLTRGVTELLVPFFPPLENRLSSPIRRAGPSLDPTLDPIETDLDEWDRLVFISFDPKQHVLWDPSK